MSPVRRPVTGPARAQLSTAQGLAAFRDELTAAGFPGELISELVLTACQADVSRDGLNVAEETMMTQNGRQSDA